MKYGYKFEIIRGYTFNKTIIFDKYKDKLYLIKKSSAKGSALYLISKLLMNCLYGKFGMIDILDKHSIKQL